jgi:hypothetical protein
MVKLEFSVDFGISQRRLEKIRLATRGGFLAIRVAMDHVLVATRVAVWGKIVSSLTVYTFAAVALGTTSSPGAAAAASLDVVAAVRELDSEHDRATSAVYRLQEAGQQAAEAIRDLWPSLSPLGQQRAIGALRALAPEFDAAVDALTEAARSPDDAVRELALDALRTGGSRGRRGLAELLSDPHVGDRAAALLARSSPELAIRPLLEAMAAPGGADRTGLRIALVRAIDGTDQPTPILMDWLASKPPPAAVASAALGMSGMNTQTESLTAFIEQALVAANDFQTAWRLLLSAGAAGTSEAIDRWVEHELRAPDAWMLRAAAVQAVTARGARQKARVALSDPYPRVRAQAATALAGDPASMIDRARLARKDSWPFVRSAAVESLGREEDAVPIVVAAIDDSMSAVRATAIEVLARAPHDAGWDRVHARLRARDEWPEVTEAAIGYAAAHCRADAAETLFRVVMRSASSQARTDDLNNAAHAVEALRILGTPAANAFVAELRRTPGVPPTLKIALARSLPDDRFCPSTRP